MVYKRNSLAIALIVALLAVGCVLPADLTTGRQPEPGASTAAVVTSTAANAPAQIPPNGCLPANAQTETATVVKIIDGDTVDVTIDGRLETVRYIGIDTPERGTTYYREASTRNGELVQGKEVLLVKDVSETDRFDRLLRYVFVDGDFVNETLVREGFAYAKEYRPDTACAEVLAAAQARAAEDRVGIWQTSAAPALVTATPTTAATQPPAGSCPTGCEVPPQGCEVKGNINSQGDKIYHIPSSGSYANTQIDPAKGERWFCTVEEAESNGWRAPRN